MLRNLLPAVFKPRPTFFNDFTSGQLDRILTYTRTGNATYFDSAGTLQTAGVNVAPFDYDPSTLGPLGLSIWEARTNAALSSNDLSNGTYWSVAANITPTGNNTTAPDGNNTAAKMAGTGTGVAHYVTNVTADPAGAKAVSIYAKAGTHGIIQIAVGGTTAPFANFDLTNGVAYSMGSANTASIQALNNGWYRCVMVTTDAAAFGLRFALVSATNATRLETNDVTNYVYMWGAQSELGAFATPVIATSGAAATRAAPAISTTDLSWFNASEGTFVSLSRTGMLYSGTNAFPRVWQIGDTSGNNEMHGAYGILSGLTDNRTGIRSGGAAQTGWGSNLAENGPNGMRSVIAYKLNDSALASSSGFFVTDTSCLIPVVTKLFVGMNDQGGSWVNGWLSSLQYFPKRLPDATLQRLST